MKEEWHSTHAMRTMIQDADADADVGMNPDAEDVDAAEVEEVAVDAVEDVVKEDNRDSRPMRFRHRNGCIIRRK
jgi:hypothetical protein